MEIAKFFLEHETDIVSWILYKIVYDFHGKLTTSKATYNRKDKSICMMIDPIKLKCRENYQKIIRILLLTKFSASFILIIFDRIIKKLIELNKKLSRTSKFECIQYDTFIDPDFKVNLNGTVTNIEDNGRIKLAYRETLLVENHKACSIMLGSTQFYSSVIFLYSSRPVLRFVRFNRRIYKTTFKCSSRS